MARNKKSRPARGYQPLGSGDKRGRHGANVRMFNKKTGRYGMADLARMPKVFSGCSCDYCTTHKEE